LSSPSDSSFFSIVIPAHNEEGSIEQTCLAIISEFGAHGISDFDILVVNDDSSDGTEDVLRALAAAWPQVTYANNPPPHGYGFAVRRGLAEYKGECVCIAMADLSDAPHDMIIYYQLMKAGHECVFGSRFMRDSQVIGYPLPKLVLNRAANWFIKTLLRIPHNDITNAFKCYHRRVVDGLQPLLSHHFNLTVELPLKAIVRGYEFVTVPVSWVNRRAGESKFHIREMGSRYLFIVLYVWLERSLSKGDYHR
jgi:dolichol-phosphate mannosyltransferase